MNGLFESVAQNLIFVLEFAAVILVLFAAALLLEKAAARKSGVKEQVFTTTKIAMIGML